MSPVRCAFAVIAGAVCVLGVGAGDARPANRSDAVTISMLANGIYQPGYDVLVRNFERVYPNIKVNIGYALNPVLYQLEVTELATDNAPDILTTSLGCGMIQAVCELAKAGDLAPLIKEPWAKRSLPLVTSLAKYGQGLFAFEPELGAEGIFTNDDLFRKLGLRMPQTFSQLLDLCRKAKAAGTIAVILAGASGPTVISLIMDLAVATVYGKDKHWTAELRAGKVSFAGTPGWHQALQKFIDMNDAGCFQPGANGTTTTSALAQFAQGQGLMTPGLTSQKGQIDADNPGFALSAHPLPDGTNPKQTGTFINVAGSVSVNAHSSVQNQAAARTFIDFLARPKQDALFAQINGGLTQYELLKGEIPGFMSSFATVFKEHEYVTAPNVTWWNANVDSALSADGIGLITGQESVDGVLNAMDAAWKQGPS